MKRYINKICILCSVLCILSSCGVYKKYQSQNEAPKDLYGAVDESGTSIAEISWREFFKDPVLQALIDSALVRNTDIKAARIAVEQAQASLKAAKLAYIPSLSLAPQASVSSTMNTKGTLSPTAYSYNIPLSMDWNIGIAGSVTVNKRKAKAVLLQAQASEEATKANLIATVAQMYYRLLLLDKQMDILLKTDSLWELSLETERALWENGQAYSTAVNQMESSTLDVKMQIIGTRHSILSAENDLCELLCMTPRHIERGEWGAYELPERYSTGVPGVLLQNRPDIKAADQMLAEAFYNTALARASFYPSFSLSGLLGWTNNGGLIADPGALLMQAAASLVQPIFSQGKLITNLKIAKLNQQAKLDSYVQTVISAGNQVNECLAECQVAKEKDVLYKRQVEVLQSAYNGTHELMNSGKASYIEVLTAQESLLKSQLNEASNLYSGSISLISLYIALGGTNK